ncbi:uncharacterized protein LOC144332223 [Macaca mulatta]
MDVRAASRGWFRFHTWFMGDTVVSWPRIPRGKTVVGGPHPCPELDFGAAGNYSERESHLRTGQTFLVAETTGKGKEEESRPGFPAELSAGPVRGAKAPLLSEHAVPVTKSSQNCRRSFQMKLGEISTAANTPGKGEADPCGSTESTARPFSRTHRQCC